MRDDIRRRRERITVQGDAPADVLVGLLDEAIMRLDADGALAVRLTDARLDDAGLHGVLDVVDLRAVHIHGAAPKAATWHGARLDRTHGRWEGAVMLDL